MVWARPLAWMSFLREATLSSGLCFLLWALLASFSLSSPASSVDSQPASIIFRISVLVTLSVERMSLANSMHVGISISGSTTRLTRPQSRAVSASRKLPVKLSSFARLIPISRGSFCESPHPGTTPTLACVSANLALGVATRKSHIKAISKPPVIAKPFTAPMIGLPTSRMAISISRLKGFSV